MTAPTVYYSTDAGVPVLSDKQDQFYQIFRACLVDGYGTKAAAGWSVVYDDWANSGYATFTNAASSAVLGIVRAAGAYQPFLFVAEAMIDESTPVNARSGYLDVTTPWSPSDTTNGWQRPAYISLSITSWCVVANDNTAVFMMAASDAYMYSFPSSAISSSQVSLMGVGAANDYRGLGSVSAPNFGNFLIWGGSLGGYGYGDFNSTSSVPTVASSVTCLRAMDGSLLTGSNFGAVYPFFTNAPSGNVPRYIADGYAKLRMVSADVMISANSSSSWRNYLWQRAELVMIKTAVFISGYSAAAATIDILSTLDIDPVTDVIQIDSKDHILAFGSYTAAMFISIDAEDWL